MPETSEKILAQLNTKKRELDEMDTFGLYLSGNKVTDKPEILFARMDIKEVMAKVEEMRAAAAEAAKPAEEAAEDDGIDLEPKAEITYDDFANCSSRSVRSLSAKQYRSPKSFSAPR